MSKRPFLLNFKQEISCIDPDQELEDIKYSDALQLGILPSGVLTWSARSKRRPTSCSTGSRRIKSGYTSSGKWKPSRVVKARRDRRVGK
jgi:hypothetical protein